MTGIKQATIQGQAKCFAKLLSVLNLVNLGSTLRNSNLSWHERRNSEGGWLSLLDPFSFMWSVLKCSAIFWRGPRVIALNGQFSDLESRKCFWAVLPFALDSQAFSRLSDPNATPLRLFETIWKLISHFSYYVTRHAREVIENIVFRSKMLLGYLAISYCANARLSESASG